MSSLSFFLNFKDRYNIGGMTVISVVSYVEITYRYIHIVFPCICVSDTIIWLWYILGNAMCSLLMTCVMSLLNSWFVCCNMCLKKNNYKKNKSGILYLIKIQEIEKKATLFFCMLVAVWLLVLSYFKMICYSPCKC